MQKQVTLDPGVGQRVSFLIAPTRQGTYSIQFDGLTGTFEAIEPDLELVQAQWGKDTHLPSEIATLTARFKNPTAGSWTYRTVARYTDVYTGLAVTVEKILTLEAGEQTDVSYEFIAPDSTRFMYVEVYCLEELIRTFQVPDLVVSVPTAEAFFIMLGGINNERIWQGDIYTGYYTKTGTVMNVGEGEGSQEVVGWWRVGNYGQVYDAFREVITLKPGEKREISYTISAEEMLLAQEKEGWVSPTLYWLVALISTPDYSKLYTDQGWLYTSDIVHI